MVLVCSSSEAVCGDSASPVSARDCSQSQRLYVSNREIHNQSEDGRDRERFCLQSDTLKDYERRRVLHVHCNNAPTSEGQRSSALAVAEVLGLFAERCTCAIVAPCKEPAAAVKRSKLDRTCNPVTGVCAVCSGVPVGRAPF